MAGESHSAGGGSPGGSWQRLRRSKFRASFAALRAYLERFGGGGPEGYLRTRYRTNADRTIAGLWAPDAPVRQAMSSAIQAGYKPYDPERIRVPALAIYALPKSADDLMRRGSSDPARVARARRPSGR